MTVLYPSNYSPSRSFRAKVQRRLTQWCTTRKLGRLPQSMITFSFDDFPKSAADTGADILSAVNAKAIYYACTGFAGRTMPTGQQYDETDIKALVDAGHEIGAHTHTHLDCSVALPNTVMADIDANLDSLKAMGVNAPIKHFAYPYGETNLFLKGMLQHRFDTCRGVLAGQNSTDNDRMQLRAMELTAEDTTKDRALSAIETAVQRRTWLHIFTHDVRHNPSPYGTTPSALRQIVRMARDSGIVIVTPTEALNLIQRETS